MKKYTLIAASLILLVASNAAAISPQEIMTLARIGVSADEMIKAIDRDKTVFKLSVSEILELKKAGIPDKVLKYMLKTPQIYGDETDTGATPPQTPPTTPDEMTPEERAALEARQRAEAERLAEDARKASEAQRQAFAQGILKKGMDLARSQECVPAIKTFLDFINQGGYQRGTDEHYTAWYGIAHALGQCDLHQSAARYLVDVVLEGPEKPFFQQSFWDLRAIRAKINYSPPDLEELTKFSVANFSRRFQDEYNYFLGEFFYDYSNYSRALKYFEAVSDDAPDYPKALYLTGLVQTQNSLYRSAVQSFQGAIIAAESIDGAEDVATLAYLALARIAYEAQNFDAAIYYYRKVPSDSPKVATGFYESAWTYFVKGDYSRALGTFHALHSPYFSHYFYPELWILEATAYVNMCRPGLARQAINQFDSQVSALAEPLKQLLGKLRTPQDYFKALVGIVKQEKTHLIDKRVIRPVLSNVEFYNLYKTVRQIEREERILGVFQNDLGQFGADLMAKLSALRQSRVNEAGIKVQQILKQLEGELADYAVKKLELEVDIAGKEIDEQTRIALGEEPIVEAEQVEKGGSTALVGSDSMRWAFIGEYWRDEIAGFRSFLGSKCQKEPAL
ncbi:MAG: tetratricopeptide (TPR) repeat protein [Myxococcota bacterium]|jgi:tetratricopeptide (TPR) repeat protein